MGKKSKAHTRRGSSSQRAHVLRTSPNWPLLALGGAGIVLTSYLSWAGFSGSQMPGCAVDGGCDLVLSSRWATLLGLPTAVWGLLGYVALAGIAFIRRADRHWSWAFTTAFVGVCYSVYLTAVSFAIIGAACPYCLTSLALMSGALALVVAQRPPELAHRSWTWTVAGRGILTGLVILVLHVNYVRPEPEVAGPEDPDIRALAEHLDDEGARFYGASWCSHCQEQKRLFGASVERLPYIECSLGESPNSPQSGACRAAGVRSYPTWVINGQAYVGQVMSLNQLAMASGFPDAARFP